MANTSAAAIRLCVLGDARIVTPLGTIEPSAEFVFGTALYLLLQAHQSVSRRTLERLLWPDVSPAAASHRLRQTLLKLRKLGLPIEPAGTTRVALTSIRLSCDIDSLATPIGMAWLSKNTMPPVLPGFDPQISNTYLDWLDLKRAEINSQLTRSVLRLVERGRSEGDWNLVEAHTRSLLSYSPGNEGAALALAEALAMRGDRLEGIKTLDRYLAEIGDASAELKVRASRMKKRIAEGTVSPADDASGETEIVGRSEQMQALISLLRDARSGRGATCYIWGSAGIGKSRLLTEFMNFASLQGVGCQRVQSRASDQTRPLAVLLDLIPLLRGMRGAIGSAPETLEFFERLTKHHPKKPRPSGGPAISERTHVKLENALSDTLDAISEESPVVLAIEDSHWLDQASASVLSAIIGRISNRPILLLLTSRDALSECRVRTDDRVRELPIPPLSDSDSSSLILAMVQARGHDIKSPYLAWCVRVAGGNPYFLQQLCNHWIDTGQEYVVPMPLAAVLKSRLTRLSSAAMQLLQACALLENHSTLSNLELALGYQPFELLSSINELVKVGMATTIHADQRLAVDAIRLTSRHDLLSDIALHQLTPPARAYLHRRAATVIESLIKEESDASMLWSCAKHWQSAGEGENALRLAKSCALHLLQAGLPTDALEAFNKARTYCTTEADLLPLLEGQVTAAYLCSAWQQVIDLEQEARIMQNRIHQQSSGHDDLELMALRAEWQNLNWDVTLNKSLGCLDAADASARHRVEAGVMALMLLSHSDQTEKCEPAFRTIIGLATTDGVPEESILQARMVFHTNWGSIAEATAAARLLVNKHRNERNFGELFRSLCNAAVTFRVAGYFGEAYDSLQQALALADEHHLFLAKVRVIPMVANLALETGDPERARYWHDQLQLIDIASEDKFTRLETIGIGVRIALLDQDALLAKRLLEPEFERIANDQIPNRKTYNLALRVAIEIGLDGRANSETVASLEQSYTRSRGNIYQGFATFALCVGLRSIGKSTRAEDILNDYLNLYRREKWPPRPHLKESLSQIASSKSVTTTKRRRA